MTDVKPHYPWTRWQSGGDHKILVVRLGSLGDIVHTIPAQQALHRELNSAQIDWLVKPPYADLLRHVRGIRKVWEADTKAWTSKISSLQKMVQLITQLRQEQYDAVFDFQGLMKSAILGRLAAGRCLVGMPKRQLRERFAHLFYTHSVELTEEKRHQVEAAFDLTSPPRYEPPISAEIQLDLEPSTEDYIETELDRLGIEKPILLNPGGGWPTKRWPASYFAKLAEQIEGLGFPTLFTYGPGEEHLLEEVEAAGGPRPLRAFPTSILELAVLCRCSRLMVAGDTGPMHLAVAMGTPVVALLGPAYAWRTGAYGRDNLTLMHERACPHPYKRECSDHFCMDIEVDRVFQAVQQRLESAGVNLGKEG